jgi:hypothetical protein
VADEHAVWQAQKFSNDVRDHGGTEGEPAVDGSASYGAGGVGMCAITNTSGEHAHANWELGRGAWSLPKRDLITTVHVLLERDELRIARRMV